MIRLRTLSVLLLFAFMPSLADVGSPRPPAFCDFAEACGSHLQRAGRISLDAPASPWTTAALPQMRASPRELARGVFLIAGKQLNDPNFLRTVILLLEYDATGALGLIINRPSQVSLGTLLPDVEGLGGNVKTVFLGGPVGRNQLFLLVRSEAQPGDSKLVVDGIYSSTSLETLRQVASDTDTAFHAYAGYAGWAPAQLDREVLRGDWLIAPADVPTVFDEDPENVWPDLMRRNTGTWVYAPESVPENDGLVCYSSGSDACR
jgi:putative transcriptional regulator